MKITLTKTVLFIFYLSCSLTVFSSLSKGEQLDIKFLLNKIKEQKSKISNISYSVEYDDFHSKEALSLIKEEINKMKGLTVEQKKILLTPHKYQIQRWLLDKNGRSKAQVISMKRFDSEGKLISEESEQSTHSWDGETYFYFKDKNSHDSRQKDYGSLGKKQTAFLTKQRRVGKMFGETLIKSIEKANANEIPINVSEKSDGKYHIYFTDEKYKREAIIDASKGYSCISVKWYKDGKILLHRSAKYYEVDAGIWFPEIAQSTIYLPNGNEKFRTIMKTKNVKVNEPNITKKSFQTEFPLGAIIRDNRIGMSYIIGKQGSERLLDSGTLSSGMVAEEELKNLDEYENNCKSIIYVPESNRALKKGIPFILNLKTKEFLNAPVEPNSVEAYEFLVKKKKGDIAWNNGELLFLRNSKIDINNNKAINPDMERPLSIVFILFHFFIFDA